MSNRLGSLVVSLGLDAGKFTEGMTKAEYQAFKTTENLKKSFASVARFVGGLAIGGALVQSIRSTAYYAKEIDNLSKIAGVGTTDLQGYAFAAQSVGIQTEKLADIFKDVQDKVGDFLQTGGGPLADFFENIAPKVGVTAEQFRKLGGKDALQLYVDSLQKAGVSQNEMVFYLEAIASDATALLPLLQDNGREFANLATQAQNLGAVMDESAIRSAKEFGQNLDQLSMSFGGIIRNMSGPLIEKLADASAYFLKVAGDVGIARAALISFGAALARTLGVDEIGKLETQAKANANAIALTVQQIERFQKLSDQGVAGASDRVAQLRDQYDQLQKSAAKTGDAIKGLANEAAPLITPTPFERPRLADTRNAKQIAAASKASKPAESEAEKERRKRDEEYDAFIKKMEDDRFTYLARRNDQALDEVDRKREESAREAARLYDQTRTPLERLGAEQSKLNDLLNAGAIDWDVYARASMDAQDEFDRASDKAQDAAKEASAFGQIMTSAFEDAILEGKKFSDVLKGLAQDILRLILRKQVTEPLAQAASGALGGLFGGVLGGSTPKAPNSGGGPFLNSLLSFEGGGWTGDGPRSGGLDGKGGYLAMVHPRERITDTTMGGSGGGVVINQYNTIDARGSDAGVDAKIQAAMKQTKAETLAAVQSKANRGGGFAASVGRA